MRFVVAILFTLIGSYAFAAGLAAGDVSVRLRPLKGAISIAGTDLKVLSVESKQNIPLIELKGFDRLSFSFTRTVSGDAWTILNPADDKILATVNGAKVAIVGQDLRVDLRPAPNHVELVAKSGVDKRGPISLVGFLSIEDYLEGVVASEVPGDWPMEALKAQAIAARSFTLAKIRERARANPEWLLESNVTDQVFDYERGHSRASAAVRATKGEILTAKGEVVAANYHSDCGGHTDEARTIWGGGVKTGTAVDAACSLKRSPWRFVRSLAELTSLLSATGLIPEGFKLASLSISGRSSGGRALSLRAKSNDGASRSIPGEKLRAALGYSDLKSTLFEVRTLGTGESAQLEFTGRGFGHGTGLCQWGARELAQNGKTYREILQHYYPLLTLSL